MCQDSDYDEKEENATAITKVEPDPRSPKETVEKNLFKGAVKVNRELAIIIPEQGGRDLLDVIKEVDDLFLKAADSAETVSNILETRKVHYHSSFSENLRGENMDMKLLWCWRAILWELLFSILYFSSAFHNFLVSP